MLCECCALKLAVWLCAYRPWDSQLDKLNDVKGKRDLVWFHWVHFMGRESVLQSEIAKEGLGVRHC